MAKIGMMLSNKVITGSGRGEKFFADVRLFYFSIHLHRRDSLGRQGVQAIIEM
jgi:hypothetical protein